MSISRWQPFGDLMSLRDAMDRLFEESFVQPARMLGEVGNVPLDIYQQNGALVVKASLPGVKPEDVDVSVTGDTLTIKGERKEEQQIKKENLIRREQRFGAFTRSITLPTPVDAGKAQATFQDGVLTLNLPVAEEAKAKGIPVRAGP